MRTLTGPGSGTFWPLGMIWYAPRICIGTTGVPVSRARCPTPDLKSWIRPSGERLPSGNNTRFHPDLRSWLELCSCAWAPPVREKGKVLRKRLTMLPSSGRGNHGSLFGPGVRARCIPVPGAAHARDVIRDARDGADQPAQSTLTRVPRHGQIILWLTFSAAPWASKAGRSYAMKNESNALVCQNAK